MGIRIASGSEEENTAAYKVQVTYNKKRYMASFSQKTYGKYAYELAQHFEKTLERLGNYYIEHEDYIELILYHRDTDTYYSSKIDKDQYSKAKEIHWIAYFEPTNTYVKGKLEGNIPIFLHQLIMGTHGTGKYVDHIDGDGLNNMRSNLRTGETISESIKINNKNKHTLNKNNKSGVTGVKKEKGSWIAVYRDKNGFNTSRRYSIEKYGEETAFELAKYARKVMVETNDNKKIDDKINEFIKSKNIK